MTYRHDPDGTRLPIKVDSTSNGEFAPIPLTETNALANRVALERATYHAKRRGVDRRSFLISSCGAASTLLAMNGVNASAGKTGGRFALEQAAADDPELAAAALEGREFIFDVQGHFVDPSGRWIREEPERGQGFGFATKTQCELADQADRNSHLQCIGPKEFVKDVFLDSDTDMMVLSFVPSTREAEPLTIEEADRTRRIVADLEGNQRLMLHGRVNPNQDGDLEAMDELKERWNVCGWKTYTQYGPGGVGFFLHDEETGIPFIEKARRLGVKIICVHKGLPFGPKSYEHSQCSDIGIVAKRFPDVDFLVYHSGYVAGKPEGPYEGEGSGDGIDTLVRSLIENDVAPNSNVYAELGSTWRFLMREPDSAAHALGKLFKYVGQDNVLWGTDSIWYGSPQDQIQAFRVFEISAELEARHGYPAITPELRAKVFGLNATRPYGIDVEEVRLRASRDELTRRRENYRNAPDPKFATYGPKTRREFLTLKAWERG
ncbi:MAG TPA: amidohydrolase family protein [Vicinamibacteria bacterium]|nr:amidohydrolase family protein [Vicinamibacteria bacterium]